MSNLDFQARFTLMPNRLNHKMHTIDKQLYEYCCGRGNALEIKNILQKYKSINLYLNLIAEHNNKSIDDKEVLEAYWIGNDLIKNITSEHIKQHIHRTFGKDPIVTELIAHIPEGCHPHHTFHLLHIKKVMPDPSIPYSNFEKCKISVGKVKDIETEKLILEDTTIDHDLGFVKNIQKGDHVAYRWDFAIDKLSEEQAEQLLFFTDKHRKILG
tara:strand:+ start:6009 stop:6647 length:639 start_codon:yes stop_codon:yes gene_type:complete